MAATARPPSKPTPAPPQFSSIAALDMGAHFRPRSTAVGRHEFSAMPSG